MIFVCLRLICVDILTKTQVILIDGLLTNERSIRFLKALFYPDKNFCYLLTLATVIVLSAASLFEIHNNFPVNPITLSIVSGSIMVFILLVSRYQKQSL